MRHPLAFLCFTLAATASSAAGYDRPWSVVEPADESQVRKEFRPAITQVDGKSTRDPRDSNSVEPGRHQVKIRFETGRVAQSPEEMERLLDLDLAPCTRYRIAAQRTTPTKWQPKVYSEKIGECATKFPQ